MFVFIERSAKRNGQVFARANGAGRTRLRSTNTALKAILKACKLIENVDVSPDVKALAKATGMSPSHFQRIFKSLTGVTPKQYATAHRSKRVRNELSMSTTVTEAIYSAGFNSNGRFYETSNRILGMTPTALSRRRHGDGHSVRGG